VGIKDPKDCKDNKDAKDILLGRQASSLGSFSGFSLSLSSLQSLQSFMSFAFLPCQPLLSSPPVSEGFIPPHGGYKKLLSYQKAEIVYDATVYFCGHFIDRQIRQLEKGFLEAGGLRERMTRARLETRGKTTR
jgi:four helix bundle suffix protein